MKTSFAYSDSFCHAKPLNFQQRVGCLDQDDELKVLMEDKSRKKNNQNIGDRFIPKIRSNVYNMLGADKPPKDSQPDEPKAINRLNTYEGLLSQQILGDSTSKHNNTNKIMSFNQENYSNTDNFACLKTYLNAKTTKPRRIQKDAYKVLEAPSLQDDFYLNLLDWSLHNNIAVGLQNSVYLWSGCSSKVARLWETEEPSDYICSVSFSVNNPNHISIGNVDGHIKLFDIAKHKQIQTLEGHTGRVGSLNWSSNGPILASGARDGSVIVWDCRKSTKVEKYKAHGQQICGLKWSNDGSYIASGGNDNKLVVYSKKAQKELARFHEHKAAVKAIGWCPQNNGILASGGGTADRHIRFFSTHSLSQTNYIDTGSQVCNLAFSKVSNQMVSTHGYSLNQINVWSTKSSNWQNNTVEKIATLTGHTFRVLYLASSPDGCSVLTGAGDETLRFWNVFDKGDILKQEFLTPNIDLR